MFNKFYNYILDINRISLLCCCTVGICRSILLAITLGQEVSAVSGHCRDWRGGVRGGSWGGNRGMWGWGWGVGVASTVWGFTDPILMCSSFVLVKAPAV